MLRHFILFLLLISCQPGVNQKQVQDAKNAIVQTERDFESMAKTKGLSEAFSYYADSSACLNRGSYVIHGKDSIRMFYTAPRYKDVLLEWKPDFVEVSASADLGYTYGKYTFTAMDSAGNKTESKGIFHTVWKKQANGVWRFVWD